AVAQVVDDQVNAVARLERLPGAAHQGNRDARAVQVGDDELRPLSADLAEGAQRGLVARRGTDNRAGDWDSTKRGGGCPADGFVAGADDDAAIGRARA